VMEETLGEVKKKQQIVPSSTLANAADSRRKTK
jgi:hypothetical protein